MKLNPEDLVVSSFETSPEAIGGTDTVLARPGTTPWEPTPATHCFVCPVETENCW